MVKKLILLSLICLPKAIKCAFVQFSHRDLEAGIYPCVEIFNFN